MNWYLIGALTLGTVLMFSVMLICNRAYGFRVGKIAATALLLTFAGVLSVKLMYFIENGSFSGQSFFGAIFFVPLLFVPITLLLRLPYRSVLDLCAPSICIMLAIMKLECLRSGCCIGKFLYFNADGKGVRFPSRELELAAALIIMAVLIMFIRKGKLGGKIYPVFMIVYGIARFILNWFRETTPFIFGLPAGNFWSIISVIAGAIWLISLERSRQKKEIAS